MGCVFMNWAFQVEACFPLHPFAKDFLGFFDLALAQLTPNAGRMVMGACYSQWSFVRWSLYVTL